MRLIKTLGLAAVAALAAMAFIGASSASAVTLCKEAAKSCPEAQRIAVGTELVSSLSEGEAVLTGTLEVKCKTSSVNGKTTTNNKTSLLGIFDVISFGSCTNCSTVQKNKPEAHLTAIAPIGNGLLVVLKPEIELVCFGGLTRCLATATEVDLDVLGGNPALIHAVNEPLSINFVSGINACGTTGTWNALYKLTAPNAGKVFVSAEP